LLMAPTILLTSHGTIEAFMPAKDAETVSL
jgi:hypothetical protein